MVSDLYSTIGDDGSKGIAFVVIFVRQTGYLDGAVLSLAREEGNGRIVQYGFEEIAGLPQFLLHEVCSDYIHYFLKPTIVLDGPISLILVGGGTGT